MASYVQRKVIDPSNDWSGVELTRGSRIVWAGFENTDFVIYLFVPDASAEQVWHVVRVDDMPPPPPVVAPPFPPTYVAFDGAVRYVNGVNVIWLRALPEQVPAEGIDGVQPATVYPKNAIYAP